MSEKDLINEQFLAALGASVERDAAAAAGAFFIKKKMKEPSLMRRFAEEMAKDEERRKLHMLIKGVLDSM